MLTKAIDFKVKKLVDSLFVWNYKTAFRWRGLEFSDFKVYEESDDPRFIDFIASEKEWKLLVKKYIEERELKVYFLLDISDSMDFWIWDKKKIDSLQEAFYILAYTASLNNDLFWAIIYDEYKYDIIKPSKWKKQILKILKKIQDKNLSFNKTSDFNINKLLAFLKVKNSLIFNLTDDIWGLDKKDLKMLGLKNDFIYINIFDSFENNLSQEKLVYKFGNTFKKLFVNLRDFKKVNEYRELRTKKINNFKKLLKSYNIDYILLDNKKNIGLELLRFFKTR